MSDHRWALYIDVEGFSARWAETHVAGLGELMLAISRIGRRAYPDPPERLFAYQLGDAFLIVSDFHEASLDRCAMIAITLMRHLAATGHFARAAIAEGELADIRGCYPPEVFQGSETDGDVDLGQGLLTITPVMGSALIQAARVIKSKPPGPLLVADTSSGSRFENVPYRPSPAGVLLIDWVHAASASLSKLQTKAGLHAPSSEQVEQRLRDYCDSQELPPEWQKSVTDILLPS